MKYQHRRDHHTGANTREARRIAEKALGKPLPPDAEVHHVDGDPAKHTANLVICEDNSYHKLLHVRTEALMACGHASWKRCWVCKEYDSPENLEPAGKRGFQHRECRKQYLRERPIQDFCCYCKEHDSPENLQVNKANGQCYHKECVAQYRRSHPGQQRTMEVLNSLIVDLRKTI